MSQILPRTRFAPSPTGFLHVGSLRTALYSYLFAKKAGGTYLLRIEDTDQKRFVEGALESLVQSLDTMGVGADEGFVLETGKVHEKGDKGPYQQSKRLDMYKQYVDQLVAEEKAYPCFCTAERLDEMRKEQSANKQAPKYDKHCANLAKEDVRALLDAKAPHVIRINVSPERGEIVFDDLVRGAVRFHAKEVDDQVLMKTDGFPTYHLAVVVDDHLMGITHVLRSEEWLPSTPKHILLFEAFGWEVPAIGHVSFILGPDGKKKLSKRDGGAAVEDYLAKGYLKEALLNFLALLGWNPGSGSTQEIFSLEELTQVFDLKGLHKAGAAFDNKKLDWMNGEYIKKLSLEELYDRVVAGGFLEKPLIQAAPDHLRGEAFLKKVLTVEQDRLARLDGVGEDNSFFFTEELSYETSLLPWKQNSLEETKEVLAHAKGLLENASETIWEDRMALETLLMEAAEELARTREGGGKGDFLWPLRVALSGAQKSPSPFEVAWVLGQKESLSRIEKALQKLSA